MHELRGQEFTESIRKIASVNLSEGCESDVREDVITPILHLLGYLRGTTAGIDREKGVKLNKAFQRIGRERIQIDYVPTLRLKRFWIIEAKPPGINPMGTGDLLQAYFYATHPEVKARFFVMCNGIDLEIYDVTSFNFETPVLELKIKDLESKWSELEHFLAADHLLNNLYKSLKSDFKTYLDVEINDHRAESVLDSMAETLAEKRGVIHRNRLETWATHSTQGSVNNQEILESKSLETLTAELQYDPHTSRNLILELVKRVKNNPKKIRDLRNKAWGRPTISYRIGLLALYAELLTTDSIDSKLVVDLSAENLVHWANHPLQNTLIRLEHTILRVLSKWVAMEGKDDARSILGPILKEYYGKGLYEVITQHGLDRREKAQISLVDTISRTFLFTLLHKPKSKIDKFISSFEAFEKTIDPLFRKELLPGVLTRIPEDELGENNSILVRGTLTILSSRPSFHNAPSIIEKIITTLRKYPTRSAGPDSKTNLVATLKTYNAIAPLKLWKARVSKFSKIVSPPLFSQHKLELMKLEATKDRRGWSVTVRNRKMATTTHIINFESEDSLFEDSAVAEILKFIAKKI